MNCTCPAIISLPKGVGKAETQKCAKVRTSPLFKSLSVSQRPGLPGMELREEEERRPRSENEFVFQSLNMIGE